MHQHTSVAAAVVIASLAVSGFAQFVPNQSTSAEWVQPGIWDVFPPDGERAGFNVWTNTHQSQELSKVASQRDQPPPRTTFSVGISVRPDNVTSFSVTNKRELGQARVWSLLDQAFEDLDLGDPMLDRAHTWAWHKDTTM